MLEALLKAVKNRYKMLVIEMDEDYALLVRDGGKDSKLDTNMEWVQSIFEHHIEREDQDNYLDLAAISILMEELIIKQQ